MSFESELKTADDSHNAGEKCGFVSSRDCLD